MLGADLYAGGARKVLIGWRKGFTDASYCVVDATRIWLKLRVIIRRTSSCQSFRGAEDFRQEGISDYLQLV